MRTIITIILALVAMTGLAQEIKMNETAISDYIPLLNAKGYQAYSFDVSAIKGRNLTVNCRDFVNGKEVELHSASDGMKVSFSNGDVGS